MPTTSTASTPAAAQPVGQRRPPSGPRALEAGVRRRVLALVEDRLEQRPVQVGVQLDPAGADHAVRRPGVDEVRVLGEVAARVDVVVAGRDDVVVVRLVPQVRGDRRGHRGPAGDRAASRPRRSRSARRPRCSARALIGPDPVVLGGSALVGPVAPARRSATAAQPPPSGTVGSAGRPVMPARPVGRSASTAGSGATSPLATRFPPRTSGTCSGRSCGPSSGRPRETSTSSVAVPVARCRRTRGLAAAVGGLVLRPLRHRPAVHLDQLVDHAGGRRAGAGDQRGAHPVDVDRARRTAPAMANSSRSPDSTIRVPVAPSESSSSRACRGQHGQVAGVDPDRAERRAGDLDRGPDARWRCRRCRPAAWCRCRARRPGPGTRRASSSCSSVNACAAVPAVGHAVPAAGLQVGRGGEAGEVGGPGGGHRRLLVGAPGAHLDQRPVAGRGDHPGRGRGDRAVVVEHRQRQRLQQHGLAERAGHGQHRRVGEAQLALGVAVDVAGEPALGQPVERRRRPARSRPARPARRGRTGTTRSPRAAGRCRPPRRTAGRSAAGGRTSRRRSRGRPCRPAAPRPAWSARTGR